MIRLNLTSTQQWMILAPGLRLPIGPLTTAPLSTARAEMAIEPLPETTSAEKLAAARAKAVARRAILEWECVGDENGSVVATKPDGFDALLEIWPVLSIVQTKYVANGLILDPEKTSPRLCRVVLRR